MARVRTIGRRRMPLRGWRIAGTLGGIALFALGSALAQAPPREERRDDDRPWGVRLRLKREHLEPRVSLALESISSFQRAAEPARQLSDHVMFDEMTEIVRRGAERVTRRAVRDYMLRTIGLSRGIERVRASHAGAAGDSRLRFRFGVHSMDPEVGVTYQRGHRALGFRLGTDGELGLHFRDHRFARTSLSVGIDPGDRVTLAARVDF